ncbi:MAG: CDGSH iron-sulfur domain-containing protein [Proteobacteria bacterium]|nr:CDGSH iron-sulfur domain-containing protein [Pseudomonadota bacterium]
MKIKNNEVKINQKKPYVVNVEEGKTYYWCSCGNSKNQPFCDDSHSGSSFSPIAYTAEETKLAYFCGCKESSSKPFCDGTHTKI